ncbi:DUF58 domain-containing protein [Halobacillus salinus]|uniref:DUF58 domain-containing protein n=1 Tax=Halobacillus salinus TaxID=192814 RepID=A0A4Z0GVN0_9BACI|nr:DUF58 domain-containing protein [Halobacillus salinus]TGB01032.1 DUF58 domain-containing protein [Halobacillus salinus]
MKQKLEFILKLLFVAFLFCLLFSYAMFQGGFVSWFLFYAFLPFLVYMFGILIYPINSWNVERKLSKRVATGGESVEVDVTIRRKIPFPVYYCVIEEYLPHSLKKKDTHFTKFRNLDEEETFHEPRKVKRVTFPWFSKNIKLHYTIDQVPRGEHELNALRVKTGDFFGFVKKEHVFLHSNKLLVFPYRRPVKLKENVYSFEQGASPSFKLNEKNTNIVTGVREYIPGDRFAWVDWKTTAKKDQMMTKEFEQEKSVDMMLILNATYHASVSSIRFEGAVEFSASLLDQLQKSTSQLAFMTLGDERSYFPFQKNATHQHMIQAHLAKVRAVGRTPFAQQLQKEHTRLPSGMIAMVVSPLLDEEIAQALVRLAKKSKRLVLFYVRSAKTMTFQDHQQIKQLKNQGVHVQLISEEQLTQQEFEVNT